MKVNPRDEEITNLTVHLPKDIAKRFRVTCVERDMAIGEGFVDALTRLIDDERLTISESQAPTNIRESTLGMRVSRGFVKKVKIACIERDTTMQKLTVAAINHWL